MPGKLAHLREEIGQAYEEVLKRASDDGEYAKCLREVMQSKSPDKTVQKAFADCAKKHDVSSKLGALWSTK